MRYICANEIGSVVLGTPVFIRYDVNIDFDKPLIFNTFFTVLYQPRLFLANIGLFRPFCFFIGFFFTPNTGLLGGFGRFGNFALAVFIMELIHLS